MYEGQIVKGKVAGTFVIIAMRNMHGKEGAQVKSLCPHTLKMGPGEMWLPLTALRAA